MEVDHRKGLHPARPHVEQAQEEEEEVGLRSGRGGGGAGEGEAGEADTLSVTRWKCIVISV